MKEVQSNKKYRELKKRLKALMYDNKEQVQQIRKDGNIVLKVPDEE